MPLFLPGKSEPGASTTLLSLTNQCEVGEMRPTENKRNRCRLQKASAACFFMFAALAGFARPLLAHDQFEGQRELYSVPVERDPSNPWAKSSTQGYSSVTGDVRSYRPVEPLPWGGTTKGTVPAPGPKQGPEHQEHH
jgi:hypothetical protein